MEIGAVSCIKWFRKVSMLIFGIMGLFSLSEVHLFFGSFLFYFLHTICNNRGLLGMAELEITLRNWPNR